MLTTYIEPTEAVPATESRTQSPTAVPTPPESPAAQPAAPPADTAAPATDVEMGEAEEEPAAVDDKSKAKEDGQSERDTENVKGEVRAEVAKEES